MPKYRKKPVVIEAVQWTGSNVDEITELMGEAHFNSENKVEIETLEGTMTADLKDYIIKGVKGELYPCKPDIFEATYEGKIDDDLEIYYKPSTKDAN